MHLPKRLLLRWTSRKGQAVIEFFIILPVMFLMIAIFYSLFMNMIFWETAQANLWFVLRETSTDAYVQLYSADECAQVIQKAFPDNASVSISSRWDQADDDTLRFFNWVQPLDPCFVETVNLTVTYRDYLNIYFSELSTINVSGKIWTSWQNRHFHDYQAIMSEVMKAMKPIYTLVDTVMGLLGSLPHKIVKILKGG